MATLKDFVDLAITTGWSIEETKRIYLGTTLKTTYITKGDRAIIIHKHGKLARKISVYQPWDNVAKSGVLATNGYEVPFESAYKLLKDGKTVIVWPTGLKNVVMFYG